MAVNFTLVDTAASPFIRILPTSNSHVVAITQIGEVHHSADDGATWPVVDMLPMPSGGTPGDPFFVDVIWSPPGVPDTIFVWVRTVSGVNAQAGLFKSVNGGTTWAQVFISPVTGAFTWSMLTIVDISPTHFLMSGFLSGGPTDLFESTDTGDSWAEIAAGATPTANYWGQLFRHSSGAVFASTDNGSADVDPSVFKSTDSGGTWAGKNRPGQISGVPMHLIELSDTSLLIAGTIGVWRSTDVGENWTYVLPTINYASCFEVGSGVVLALGNDGGDTNVIWRSTDFGATWGVVLSLAGSNPGVRRYFPSTYFFPMPLPLIGGDLLISVDLAFYLSGGSGWYLSTDNGVTWSTAGVTPVAAGNVSQLAFEIILTPDGSILSAGYGTSGAIWRQTGFDYALTNSGDLALHAGASGVVTVTKTLVSGATQPVSLNVTGLPAGATVVVTNDPCNPTCASLLTISTTGAAIPGTYPILVTGNP